MVWAAKARAVTVVVVVALVAATAGVVTAAGTAGAQGRGSPGYVAMGDSFTSGPLIPRQLPDPWGCLRSDHDYPHLVAATLGVAVHDVSCGGATTDDLFKTQGVRGGSNPPQLDALGPSTRLVTVGIGGNDIDFTGIAATCAVLLPFGRPCHDHYVGPAGDEISRRIAATVPKISAALAAIHQRAPSARVLLVGYPAILPETGGGCWPLMPYAVGDVPWLRDKEKELNTMLVAQAAAGRATYVDTYGPSIGHDACTLPGVRWVEPWLPLSLAAPVHPNALGMAGMAAVVSRAVGPAR